MASPFEILQVDPDADDEAIERAYRERVKEAHPDQGGSAREFRLVTAAYEAIQSGYRDDAGDAEPRDDEEWRTEFRVEYLDYEVLDDYGWALEDDPFGRAAEADLDPNDHGRFAVERGESLLEAAENRGFAWPYACRGGACANCAVAVTEGDLSMPVNHVLPAELTDRGVRLSCVGAPTVDGTKVVYNLKHLPELDELRLPPRPFEQAHLDE